MRKVTLVFCLLTLTSITGWPKSKAHLDPSHGTVSGNVYTNEYFRLVWEFPKEWKVKDVPTSAPDAHYHVLLSLLPTGNEDEEVSLSAQNFSEVDHFWKQHPDQVKTMLTQKGWQTAGTRGSLTVGDLGFEEDEYVSAEQKHSVAIMARPLRTYELKFFVSAASHERLQELLKAISSAKFTPDWTDGVVEDRNGRPPGPVTPAKLVDRVNPDYPSDARAAHVQGNVVMAVIVGKAGKIDQIYVLQGHPLLVDNAVEAVSRWRYVPYKRSDGTPISVHTEIVVNFSLSSPDRMMH